MGDDKIGLRQLKPGDPYFQKVTERAALPYLYLKSMTPQMRVAVLTLLINEVMLNLVDLDSSEGRAMTRKMFDKFMDGVRQSFEVNLMEAETNSSEVGHA